MATNYLKFTNGTGGSPAVASAAGNASNDTDVVYGPIDPALVISNAPWKVVNCNNTLEIEAETLKDKTLRKDYIARENAYFTMDMRYVKIFKAKGDKCPLSVVKFRLMTEVPYILPGSVSCIKFTSSNNATSFSMCLKTQEDALDVIESYQKFMICRIGGSLQNTYDPLTIDEIIKSTCMDIPTKHKEDETDPFTDTTKKDGKIVPRVNVKALKDFFKQQLTQNGVSNFKFLFIN